MIVMNKVPIQHKPYFPHVNHGHMSERKITYACSWWKSIRTRRHLTRATITLIHHILHEDQKRAAVVRARIYIDRYDKITKMVGLPTV